ncbi:hypothetical protein G6F46_015182 [Rhizopus delemar]|nr:hypothetical protein G6F46_015182 [Rhizopus delemar]
MEIEHGRDRRSTAVAALCQMSLDHAVAVQSLIATLPHYRHRHREASCAPDSGESASGKEAPWRSGHARKA